MALCPGIMVTDKVRLVRRLGEGAMGEVWAAVHETLRAEVAVKFLSEDVIAMHPESAERFSVEAAAAAKIKSPHVVRTFDHGTMSDGTPYIVMELLEGESLQDKLDREGPLDLTETYEVVRQVGKALDAAHAAGIVHRDVKPHNIFLMHQQGELFVKLLDFGSAKFMGDTRRIRLTQPGMLIGTPEYISRDLLTNPKGLGPMVDLWALGVVAYKCLTGEVPFQGTGIAEICQSIVDGRFRRPTRTRRDLTRAHDDWFARVFSHEAAERPRSGSEMAKSFLASGRIERRRGRRSAWRERLSMAALVVSVLLAGAAIFITQRRQQPAPQDTPAATASALLAPSSAPTAEAAPSASASADALALGAGGADGGAGILVEPADGGLEETAPEALREALAEARSVVPAGPFWMGCAADRDPDCNEDEKPGRLVQLDAYAVDRTEVSVMLYFRCVQGGACSDDELNGYRLEKGPFVPSEKCNWGFPERRHHPINCVTWAQADRYCRWAGARLPTEAEWEKAARGVDKRRFPWKGEFANCQLAVMGEGAQGCRAGGTWPVGTKRAGASPYGIFNLAGNVREWVADWYDPGYYQKAPPKNPTGPDDGTLRVGRGGSWGNSVGRFLRTSVREGLHPDTRSIHLGFRCASSDR